MKLPLRVEADTTIVDADGAFVADCHDTGSSFGTQVEYDNAQRLVTAANQITLSP